jgi:hypothetical protein
VVSLTVAAEHGNISRQLQLTEKHFLPVVAASSASQQLVHKYAKDVVVGDLLMLAGADGASAVAGRVVSKTVEQAVGLYNPYTKVSQQQLRGTWMCQMLHLPHMLSGLPVPLLHAQLSNCGWVLPVRSERVPAIRHILAK